MTNDPYALAVELYEQRLQNDPWAVREILHEKAVWEVPGVGASSDPEWAKGTPTPLAAFIEDVVSTWKWLSYEFVEVLADNARIFCRYRLKVEHAPSGKTYNVQGAEFFRIEDGLVRSIVSYADPRLLEVAAAG